MPATLRKDALLARILRAARSSGWEAIMLSEDHPFKPSIFRGDTRLVVLCYIWNLTHGGYPRNPNELRIQVTGVAHFRIEEGCSTLLLGWSEDEEMFAGFDVTKHLIDMAGRSPSLQIRRETLQKARHEGLATQHRDNNEIAFAIPPEFFVTDAQEVEQLHRAAQHAEDVQTITRMAKANMETESADAVIRDIPPGPRKTTLQQIQRNIRDARFRSNIMAAYGARCAASDMQLDLLDAAHIVPVEHQKGTDETKNGLCLSAIHHRAFDHCLMGIRRDYSIIFNEDRFAKLRTIGWHGGESAFKASCRDRINLPPRRDLYPDPDYLIFGQTLRGWNPKRLA
jgi:putative restriction endonuclease